MNSYQHRKNTINVNHLRPVVTVYIIWVMLVTTIGFGSALYGGECLSVELGYDGNVYWDVVGNSSNLEGLTMNRFGDSSIVTICAAQNYEPDNFTLIFFEEDVNIVIKEVHVGGGSSSTKYIYKNNTEYVEVDNYIDREVIVEGETIVNEVEVSKPNYGALITIIILIIALTFTSWWAVRSSRKDE